jgi:arginase
MTATRVDVIAVPFDSGHRNLRMGRGPTHLLKAGIVDVLASASADVRVVNLEPPADVFPSEARVAVELQRLVAERVTEARRTGAFPIVLSGNCNMAAIGSVSAITATSGPPVVCWLDAHADFNTPETTSSGFFDGMAVAMLTGRCWQALARRVPGFVPLPESNVMMLGVRDVDPLEEQLLTASSIRRVATSTAEIDAALSALSANRELYLHVDLDVFDPSEGRANGYAIGGGLSRENVFDLIGRITERFEIAALGLTAYDPSCDADGRIARLAIAVAAAVVEHQHPRLLPRI